ncbi:MAG: Asp-tRNA(Asn)/Glu-tRNA(Gln) amidotransferase subunit GatC [Verrucomicrobiales bacterium]
MAELDVRYVARLARLDLTDDEAAHFQAQLTGVLGYMAALDRLDVTDLEPTVHAEELHNVTRPDAARPGLSVDQALSNAPAARDGVFLTPRVVE